DPGCVEMAWPSDRIAHLGLRGDDSPGTTGRGNQAGRLVPRPAAFRHGRCLTHWPAHGDGRADGTGTTQSGPSATHAPTASPASASSGGPSPDGKDGDLPRLPANEHVHGRGGGPGGPLAGHAMGRAAARVARVIRSRLPSPGGRGMRASFLAAT